jgi:sigma-B regulation protein RsbU (phosphoserine phosphatase)
VAERRDALTQARLEAQAANAELLERWEEINLLYSIGDILGRTLDLADAASTILAAISDTVGAECGAIFVHEEASGLLRPLTVQGVDAALVEPVPIDDDASLVARTYRARHAFLESSVPGDQSDRALRRGPVLAVPVMWKSPKEGAVALGVVLLSGKRSESGFTASDEKLVSAIAAQIGTAIRIEGLVRASVAQQRLAHEMQLAHELQMRLLPATSVVSPEAQCAARVEPAQSVGGDFYHLFRLSEGRTGVLIGDVSSHGYQAALIMALTMSAMAIHAQTTADPARTVQALHTSLADELRQTEMFLSLCYAVIDPAARTLRYTNTGHPHAFIVSADGAVRRLDATDPPLGLGGDAPHAAELPWSPGSDLLVLFTDGISDARDEVGAALGEARVLDVVRARRHDTPTRIVDGVFSLLEGHMSGAAPADDQAIVVLRT